MRYENLTGLNELLEPTFATATRTAWQEKLDEAGIPSAPVQTLLETLANEQTKALGMLQQIDATQPKMMSVPLSFDGQRPALRSMAPELGEHNAQIKGERP